MKTKEELKALKEEVETLNKKLAELSEEELSQVSGGVLPDGGKIVFGLSSFEPIDIVPVPSEFDIPIEGGQQQRKP